MDLVGKAEIEAVETNFAEIPQTLGQLVRALEAFPEHALVFRSSQGDIGGGYHVTELKQANIRSIDCGGRSDEWNETIVQLLDGNHGRHMAVSKFIAIARRSEAALPGLSGAPLMIESAIGNHSLHRMTVTGIAADASRVTVKLGDLSATCKPLADWKNTMAGSCCGPTITQNLRCC